MLHIIAEVLFLSICLSAFISPRLSICLFLLHKFLIPVAYITVGPIFFPSNYLAMAIFLGFVLRNIRKYDRFCYGPLKYYFLYFVFGAFLSVFSWNQSLCLGYVKSDFITLLLIPFVLINIAKFDPKSWQFINAFCLCVIAVVAVYGLFLIPLKGFNPYTIELKALVGGATVSDKWLMAEDRLFGRITGTFTHPMYYANFLLYALLYACYTLQTTTKNRLLQLLCVVLLVCLLTCGVRSGMIALFVVFLFYCFSEKKTGTIKYLFIATSVLLIISLISPVFFDYVISPFIDEKSSSVQGSSLSMRLAQFAKAFDSIDGRFLCGYGYGWTTWYMQYNGSHPYLFGFESIIIKVVCEGGLLGVFAFLFLYAQLFKTRIIDCKIKMFCRFMIIAYVSFVTLTGDYLYSVYFVIFYSLIYANCTSRVGSV